MMKHLNPILLVLVLLSISCSGDGGSSFGLSNVLPSSTGSADEIMFILPDNLNSSSTKKAVNQAFKKSYRILPQEETIFTISKVDFSAANSLMYRFRNIVLMAISNQDNDILKMAKELLSAKEFDELVKGEKQTFILKNVWSKPQNVIFIFGKDAVDLQANLTVSASSIINHITKTDLAAHKKIAYINGVNVKLKEQWQAYYNISLDIPSEYKLAENEGSFVSLRKDIPKGMIFIYFDVVNYSGKVPDANYGITLRNERGKYVSSSSLNSYMTTDSTLGFLETKTIKNKVIKYETSGLWRMENDFMGGPFINQYIIDDINNRVILLDGFIYAPGEDHKKRYMRQLEAIFSTLAIE